MITKFKIYEDVEKHDINKIDDVYLYNVKAFNTDGIVTKINITYDN